MDQVQHNQIVTCIWVISDDVLRRVHVQVNYRDVILPTTITRRVNVSLEATQDPVLMITASYLVKERTQLPILLLDHKSPLT